MWFVVALKGRRMISFALIVSLFFAAVRAVLLTVASWLD